MVSEISPERLEDMEANIGAFEKAVARAEKLGKMAREAAEAGSAKIPPLVASRR